MGEDLRLSPGRKIEVCCAKQKFVRQMAIFVSHTLTLSPLARVERLNERANSILHQVTFRVRRRSRDIAALRRAGKCTTDPAPEVRARPQAIASVAGYPPVVLRDSWPDRDEPPRGCYRDLFLSAAFFSCCGASTRGCARLEKPSLEDLRGTCPTVDA